MVKSRTDQKYVYYSYRDVTNGAEGGIFFFQNKTMGNFSVSQSHSCEFYFFESIWETPKRFVVDLSADVFEFVVG